MRENAPSVASSSVSCSASYATSGVIVLLEAVQKDNEMPLLDRPAHVLDFRVPRFEGSSGDIVFLFLDRLDTGRDFLLSRCHLLGGVFGPLSLS